MHLVLTGGGTGGHIVPNIALIDELKARHPKDLELLYIGSRHSMEEQLMRDAGVPFKSVMTGKLRRYFSLWNLVDVVKIPIGVVQALFILRRFRPKAVFAKGGFVSFPAACAAWMLRIPVILHESDVVPGLANKLCSRFATQVCVSFEESAKHFKGKDVVVTGNPVRREIAHGDSEKAREFTGLHGKKPVLLVMGGSQGAQFLNDLVHNHLDELLQQFHVVHLAGKHQCRHENREGYRCYPYVDKELKDLYALADVVVTRSGANTLAELATVGKPAILVPLSKQASRGDQIVNARTFADHHQAHVMEEHSWDWKKFWERLQLLAEEEAEKIDEPKLQAAEQIVSLLEDL